MMSHKERFTVWSNGRTFYAPSTIGCPAMTQDVDYSVFKKIPGERDQLATLKIGVPKSRGHKFKTMAKMEM